MAAARCFAERSRTDLALVARREDRLRALAREIGGATVVAADITAADAPRRIAEVVEQEHGRLDVLVNNAGAGRGGRFAEAGWAEVARTMELNFAAAVRLTEALLPLLRRSAPSAVVNVASTAGRVTRAGAGYGASKFALCGWTDALHLEERTHGVHVGLVMPGFVDTEGFPQDELRRHPLAGACSAASAASPRRSSTAPSTAAPSVTRPATTAWPRSPAPRRRGWCAWSSAGAPHARSSGGARPRAARAGLS